MAGHHLILGELTDYITGTPLPDTHDERYRQKLARWLVEAKGYRKSDLLPRQPLKVGVGNRQAIIPIDLMVRLADRIGMLIKYGPGSVVTRQRPVLAASRLVAPYQIPVAVATNGEDADVMDGVSGRVVSSGLHTLPDCTTLKKILKTHHFAPLSTHRVEMESRLVYAYEVDGSCPCDDTICRL